MQTVRFDSHGVTCEASYLSARVDDLQTPAGRPCVVMAHGFGATRDSGLLPFAERFADAGIDALVFDYRGFGTSDGRLRQDVDHRRHREDYHAAVAAARRLPGVDPDRIALWGSSYSGGHVIVVAAQDRTIRAVVSQGAAMDGLTAIFGVREVSGGGKVASLTGAALRDLGRALTRRAPYLVPITGRPGTPAVISAPGAEQGYGAIVGPTFRNEMAARGILRIAFNRPVRHASEVRCRTLLVMAEHDNIAPVRSMEKVAALLGDRAETVSFPCGHFTIYTGEEFEKSVALQTDFLVRELTPDRGAPGAI